MTEHGMPEALTPLDQFAAARAADSSRPFLTFYDDTTGERVELSFATFDNWVAKTANLLKEGLATDAGERLSLLLPSHWLTAVWVLAGWSAGLVVSPDADPALADVAVTGPEDLDRAARAGQAVAVSLQPLAAPFSTMLPAGVLDYSTEVPAYGDLFTPYPLLEPDQPALAVGDRTWTAHDLVEEGVRAASEHGLDRQARVLTDVGTTKLIRLLLAGLAVDGSLVLCRHLDEARLERRIETERVTAVIR